jgi:signal transduction histidine kinase
MAGSKLFGERATGSSAEHFRRARWRLTLLYLAIIVAIVVILSAAAYELSAHDVSRKDRERRGRVVAGLIPEGTEVGDRPGIGEYLESLGRSIITADIVTVIVAAGLSWLLASRTLKPIKEAVETEQKLYVNAAHDLRTPLAVMRSEAEVALRSHAVSGESRKVIESSLEEIARMSEMVEQMLDLARSGIPGAARSLALQPMDLSETVKALTSKIERRAQSVGISLVTRTEGAARINGSPFALKRAVYNVLENALAYTPAGGTITVLVKKTGSHVALSVSDTGIGIDSKDLPHITEPFFRGDKARGARSGGAGLGLTIVRSTMDEHHGTLQAESAPGHGTTITLRFPAA